MRYKDLSGSKFNRLSVVNSSHTNELGQRVWECLCDCGNKVFVTTAKLSNSHTKSCGCLKKELSSKRLKTHGCKGTGAHNSWIAMLSRCNNPKTINYYMYGGAGVTVCDRWSFAKGGSFQNFLEDMGERPDGHTLNRIGGAKVYSKETCEWADAGKQSFEQKLSVDNKSGVVGVSFNKLSNKWIASINVKKRAIGLGSYSTLTEAQRAREQAELEHYGFLLREKCCDTGTL